MTKETTEYRLSPVQWGWTVGGAIFLGATALGFGIGDRFDQYNEAQDRKDLVAYGPVLDGVESDRDEAAHSLHRVEETVPEKCEVILDRYIIGGELAGDGVSNVDLAVEDALREPGQPCGDSASDIRADMVRLDRAHVSLFFAETKLHETRQTMESKERLAVDTSRNSGVSYWTGIGGVVGAIAGLMTGLYQEEQRRLSGKRWRKRV